MTSHRSETPDSAITRSVTRRERGRLRRLMTPIGMSLAMLATACVSDGAAQDTPGSTDLSGGDIELTSGLLTTYGDCDALLDQLVAEGLERVGPYGFGQDGYWGWGGDDIALADEEAAMDDSTDAVAAPVAQGSTDDAFSKTNNQEVGVDEPDLVKTDGERLVTVFGNELRVIAVGNGAPELVNTIFLPDELWAGELFLSGDTALVMSNGWTQSPLSADGSSEDFASDVIYPSGMPVTRLIEIDLAEGEVTRSLEFEGNYLSARDVDGTARVVLSATAGRFPFVYPSNPGAEEAAENANRDIIENSTIDQWLPGYRILDGSNTVVESGPVVDCDRMHIPGEFGGFGTLALLTIDLDEGLELTDSLAVLTDGQTIYASTDRLAVATTKWPEWDPATGDLVEGTEDYTTQIHTFDITDERSASYEATGSVRGHLLNQFSMSEHEGFLRVATTDGSPWGDTSESESFVTILSAEGGTLETVGQVGGLGEGEQIFAVRFLGSTAYVVTFRQIDPLYTVDLSEPTDPTVLGELKIPGFSTYLHPIDDGLVLGVGQDATDDGMTTGAQVSSFDVSDLTDPTRTSQLDLGQNTYSPIDWDKKAFTYWAQNRTAYVPISWWNWDERTNSEDNGAAVVAVRIAEDGTLTELGRVEHPALRGCESPNGYTEELIFPDDAPEPDEAPEPIEEAPDGAIDPSELDEQPAEEPLVDAPDEQPADSTSESRSADAEFEIVVDEEEPPPAPPADDAELEFVEPEEETEFYEEDGEYCWSFSAEIRRSIVVGDQLLTLSDSGVLASDLSDLSQIGWLSFEN